MKLEKQIEALKERGSGGDDVGERLRELRRSHYEGNGASGRPKTVPATPAPAPRMAGARTGRAA